MHAMECSEEWNSSSWPAGSRYSAPGLVSWHWLFQARRPTQLRPPAPLLCARWCHPLSQAPGSQAVPTAGGRAPAASPSWQATSQQTKWPPRGEQQIERAANMDPKTAQTSASTCSPEPHTALTNETNAKERRKTKKKNVCAFRRVEWGMVIDGKPPAKHAQPEKMACGKTSGKSMSQLRRKKEAKEAFHRARTKL